jgi:hypothetical protein
LLLSSSDIWHLIGYAHQHDHVLLQAWRAVRNPKESWLDFAMREARLHLQRRVWSRTIDSTAMALTVTHRDPRSIRVLTEYAEQLRATAHADFFMFYGNSRALDTHAPRALLASLARTLQAIKIWRRDGRFPKNYSEKTLIFHVAQLSAYAAAIFLFVSPGSALILLAFAIGITPQFILTGINLMRPVQWTRRILARLLLYYVG